MRLILLAVIMLVAVVAGFATLKLTNQDSADKRASATQQATRDPVTVTTVDVLVAKAPIPLGAIIDETMIDKQPWPSHLVLDGFVVDGNKDSNIIGMVARSTFLAREPFISGKLANPNDPSFVAAGLPKGMRAITLRVDAVSGLAGYAFPGDRVDLLVTHNLPRELAPKTSQAGSVSRNASVAEVLVADAKILAVNTRPVAGRDESKQNGAPSNITLEVAQEDAERIRLAEENGKLSIMLRSIKDEKDDALPIPVTVNNLSRVNVKIDGTGKSVNIIRSGKDGGGAPASAPSVIWNLQNGQPAPLPTENGSNLGNAQ